MQILIIASCASFSGALLALLVYHLAVVRRSLKGVRGSLAVIDGLLGGKAATATNRLSALEDIAAEERSLLAGIQARLAELEGLVRTDISRIGFERYDAFDDTGSELSYALALLNREGDGVVLTSIYSRTDSRTFGKAVEKFEPVVHASPEELRAVARARDRR